MPKFNALYLVEHDSRDVENTDNRIIILYDDYEEAFFYYGTRRRERNETSRGYKYISHNGLVRSWDICRLMILLRLLFNNMDSFISSEMHVIEIDDSEYEDLDFDKVRKRLNEYNCLYAYDKIKETAKSLKRKINTLAIKVNDYN
jgi:hypothetical protein